VRPLRLPWPSDFLSIVREINNGALTYRMAGRASD
jgi:hypothetical protein